MSSIPSGPIPPRVAVIGSINSDVSFFMPAFPAPHETVLAQRSQCNTGGKGLNQAVAAAQAGAQVHMIGCVGDDDFGRRACAYAGAMGVDCTGIARAPTEATGMAGIFINDAGENMIAVAPGANGLLSPDHIAAHAGLIHGADIVLVQQEVPVGTVAAALALARRAGVRTVLNPAPVVKGTKKLIALADMVTPNETEAQALTGILPQDDESARAASLRLHELGAKSVLITMGEGGCYLYDQGDGHRLEAFCVKVVDPTGAGDVFNGVLVQRLGGGAPLHSAARAASAAAALSVTRAGAEGAAPAAAQIERFLANAGDATA